MLNFEKILELINKKIILLEKQKNIVNKKINLHNASYSSILSKVNDILIDYKNIAKLDDNDFDILKTMYDKDKIINLKVYKAVATNPNFNFPHNSQLILKDICEHIIDNINNSNEELTNEINQLADINQLLNILTKLKLNVKNDFNIDLVGLDELINLVKESDYTDNEKIDLLVYISNASIKTFSLSDALNIFIEGDENIVIDEIEVTNLSEEELIELFDKFGYDFLKLNKKAISKLKKYGKKENIESILSILKDQGIDIKKEIIRNSLALAEILIYSNSQILKNILSSASKREVSFHQLIKIPSCFISKKRNIMKLGSESLIHEPKNLENNLVGSYEDFQKNIEYLEKIFDEVYGPDKFSSSFDKCCFIFIKSHELIKRSIKVYEYYGITPSEYLKTLSSLNGYHVEEIVDLCIELDCFDYLKQNLSKATLMPDDEQFYMIARARQIGYKDDKIFNSKGLKYKSLKEDENIGIDKVNGALITNKFVLSETNKIIFKEYERILFQTSKTEEFNFSNVNRYLLNSNIDIKLRKLDELYLNPNNSLIYNINGVIISRNKVLRIYNNLLGRNIDESKELLLFALTYNSIITQEQFDMLSDEVNKIYFNKEKKLW